jgi:uncharacterized protein YjiS (DUF1127 family)
MAYLHSVLSAPNHPAFQPPRYGARMPLRLPQVDAIILFARGLAAALLRYGRQANEARRRRTHLLELDDHLFRDVGLSRADLRFGNIATRIRQSHRPELAHPSPGHRLAGEKP